jgi:hypothetical protein
VCESDAGDAGCCGQLCQHHCCSSQLKVEREELQHIIQLHHTWQICDKTTNSMGQTVAQFVEALCYRTENRRSDSR